ncbi:MAG: prolyl oligopeptidase family serine peptidase, partial [Chloroflexi bacterium]|nr:prolyl oligopeptidase family serine peptidase [Chloroflexota bacterium]
RSLPNVDPWRIGMMGGSRGGMVTYIALKTQTLRGSSDIRVAATVGGIADLFRWPNDRPDVVQGVYVPLVGATPDQNPAAFRARSAVYWPELITVPILLMHGEADTEVSVTQSLLLYHALKDAGRDVTLVTYPGDDHPLTGQLGGYPEALRFFERYIGGDGVDRQYDTHWDNIRAVSAWFYANPQ